MNNYKDDEIECDIIKSYGIFSRGTKFWNKEVNLISWNKRPAKLDIRNWQRDHKKCGKGIAITREEAEDLIKLLEKILKEEAGPEKTRKGGAGKDQNSKKQGAGKQASEKQSRKKAGNAVPKSLEPFYDELELLFGAEPGKCKSARNALLKKYHPDKNSLNIEFATRKTIQINEAYDHIVEWWRENE